MHVNARLHPSSLMPARTPKFWSALHAALLHGQWEAQLVEMGGGGAGQRVREELTR